jgi:hypothetical protein
MKKLERLLVPQVSTAKTETENGCGAGDRQ